MRIFRELGFFEVGDSRHDFGEWRVCVLLYFDTPFFYFVCFGLDEDFLSDDLVCLLDRAFWFRPRLVFVSIILNCWIFSQLQSLVGVVVGLLILILFTMKIWCPFLWVLCRRRLRQLHFRRWVWLEGHSWSQTGEDRRYFRRVLARLGSQVFMSVIF